MSAVPACLFRCMLPNARRRVSLPSFRQPPFYLQQAHINLLEVAGHIKQSKRQKPDFSFQGTRSRVPSYMVSRWRIRTSLFQRGNSGHAAFEDCLDCRWRSNPLSRLLLLLRDKHGKNQSFQTYGTKKTHWDIAKNAHTRRNKTMII